MTKNTCYDSQSSLFNIWKFIETTDLAFDINMIQGMSQEQVEIFQTSILLTIHVEKWQQRRLRDRSATLAVTTITLLQQVMNKSIMNQADPNVSITNWGEIDALGERGDLQSSETIELLVY